MDTIVRQKQVIYWPKFMSYHSHPQLALPEVTEIWQQKAIL